MAVVLQSPRWSQRTQRVFASVFPTDVSQQTPCLQVPDLPRGEPMHAFHQVTTTAAPKRRLRDELGNVLPDFSSASPSAPVASRSMGSNGLGTTWRLPFPPLATTEAPQDQVDFDRAWRVVTTRLALPQSTMTDGSFATMAAESQDVSQEGVDSDDDFHTALPLLLDTATLLPRATHTGDLLDWHLGQSRSHFAQYVLPLLSACADAEDYRDLEKDPADDTAGREGRDDICHKRHMVVVMSSIRTAEAAVRLYSYGVELVVTGFDHIPRYVDAGLVEAEAEALRSRFRRDVHALLRMSASAGLQRSLRAVLVHHARLILGIRPPDEAGNVHVLRPSALLPDDDLQATAARQRICELVEQLSSVGYDGEWFEILFANTMYAMMKEFVCRSCGNVWNASRDFNTALQGSVLSRAGTKRGTPCVRLLGHWVENRFARLTVEVLSRLRPEGVSNFRLADVKWCQEMALAELAAVRTAELYDMVIAWPSAGTALEDLRATINTPGRRSSLVESFRATLHKRLLHAGCSTLKILHTFVSMVKTFYVLDNSKVLFNAIAPSVQLYLCQRQDAVRVLVTALLHDDAAVRLQPEDDVKPELIAAEPTIKDLAVLLALSQKSRPAGTEVDDNPDWHDMAWVPDPVDAGANYKRPRGEDVIGTLISTLGSPDVFIKEFTAIVANRLLGDSTRVDREVSVLQLLKSRFGDAALQNCDVMLKDVMDSRRLDAAIRRTGGLLSGPGRATNTAAQREATEPDMAGPQYHSRILSRLFWPSLDREHFVLPAPVVAHQRRYELGYERLKAGRKLTWLNQLGQARVELELRDRTVTCDCSTVEATVIYAFQPDDEGPNAPVRKTIDDLYVQLQMDEDAIVAALGFWVDRGVLRRAADVFLVVESQSKEDARHIADVGPFDMATTGTDTASTTNMTPRAGRRGPAAGSARAATDPRRAMYWQYVCGMLTNASATMALAQMAMMLKMLVPEGFPWSNEELLEFLAEKVAEGDLEISGGKYRLVKR